jgi:hypothetical protein
VKGVTLSLRSLRRPELLALLTQAGAKAANEETLKAALAAGLPSHGGRFDFLAVCAWLARRATN